MNMTNDLDRPQWWRIARWPLWSLPPHALVAVLLVIVSALGLTIAGLIMTPLTAQQLAVAGLLTALCIVHTEFLAGLEQVRRSLSFTGYNDMTSVWTFAAALLVPPALSASAAFVMLTHIWWRSFRPAGNPAYRGMHSRSTSMLACFGVGLVLTQSGIDVNTAGVPTFKAFLVILVALLAYLTINTLLVVVTACLALPETPFADVFGTSDELAMEAATLGLGGALAVILSSLSPWVACLLLPLVLVLHRAVAIQVLLSHALQRRRGVA